MYEDGVCLLRIKQIIAEDEGEYTCEATNEAGKAFTKCFLTTTSKLFFTFKETFNMLLRTGRIHYIERFQNDFFVEEKLPLMMVLNHWVDEEKTLVSARLTVFEYAFSM